MKRKHARAAGQLDALRQAEVLLGGALERVEHEDSDVGPRHRFDGRLHGELLGHVFLASHLRLGLVFRLAGGDISSDGSVIQATIHSVSDRRPFLCRGESELPCVWYWH